MYYPLGWILNLKRKAIQIKNRSKTNTMEKEKEKYITVPNSFKSEALDRYLKKSGMRIAKSSGTKIGDIIKNRENQ